MTYVVNESCIRCKTMDCVEVCPVDCFYEGENMLVIHPDECIDCGVCEPECPVDAIKPDTAPGLEKWLALNAEYARIGQILRSKKRPHPTLRSGRGSRTNSNTSYQIQARVIEADSPSDVVYGGAGMPLGPIPEGGTFFCPRCLTARLARA